MPSPPIPVDMDFTHSQNQGCGFIPDVKLQVVTGSPQCQGSPENLRIIPVKFHLKILSPAEKMCRYA